MNRPAETCFATVLITTKDRKHVLASAIESVLAQSLPVELLVMDDGSSDGTAEMVRERFPQARLIRNEKPLGIIAARNTAAREISTDVMFTLDDDAAFSDSNVVAAVVEDMRHERVGAVAIPLVDHINDQQRLISPVPLDSDARRQADFLCVFNFYGGANALRRGLFLELGGYQGGGRQGEEHTYCARLLAAGYVVRVASHGHIDHYPGALDREKGTVVVHDMRNAMLFTWLYVPWPQIFVHMTGVVMSRTLRVLKRGQPGFAIQGFVRGCAAIWVGRRERRPLNHAMYRLMRDLITHRTLPLSRVEPHLPPRVERAGGNKLQPAGGCPGVIS
jgi:glycosyltransferase involved in cell wall biosynthesis